MQSSSLRSLPARRSAASAVSATVYSFTLRHGAISSPKTLPSHHSLLRHASPTTTTTQRWQQLHLLSRRSFSSTHRPAQQDPLRKRLAHHDPYYELSRARPLTDVNPTSRLGRWSQSRYLDRRIVAAVAVAGALLFYFVNMQTVPVSGRRRFNCFSQSSVDTVGREQAKRIIWEVEQQGGRFLSEYDYRTQIVKRVMARLIPVSGMDEDAEWEVRVIDDPKTANAFVLPGGKVFVHSGLIPIARTEDGLAAVLGHEIAHNLAEHVAERMSNNIGPNVLIGCAVLLTGGVAILGTWFFGGTILDLFFGRPMGRMQETEADYIGLMMMAEACYDPRHALEFWKRMERAHAQEPPEWMSTHPSNHNRIQKISEWMPQALEKRQQSDCQGTAQFATIFKKALRRGVVIE